MERIRSALRIATAALIAELGPEGHWRGELSSSALSTATAVTALAAVDRVRHRDHIARGLSWLAAHANPDGGWGDTVRSKSNISTTALCWAAFGAAQADEPYRKTVTRAVEWLDATRGEKPLIRAIEERYGKDRTFSVPILMTLALSGRLGAKGWECVIPLPFELAALPHQIFGAARLPVVSYALPALIAIGQAIHHHHPTRNPLLRAIRELTRKRTLENLAKIQPVNGGFLEATPLTSFVTMSLASMGLENHLVAQRGADFLRRSMRQDGSWPIDTDLATWVTTLSLDALSRQSDVLSAHPSTPALQHSTTESLSIQPDALSMEQRLSVRKWLLGQQYRVEHPYTHAAPGGWAWTDLPGGVPDADDTAGALLALAGLGAIDSETRSAGLAGVQWLLGLQNGDGGIPTFCRGWGALPFDRSAPDLTAHALRAWIAWLPHAGIGLKSRILRAIRRALDYLRKTQRADGSWLPLWFGNEHAPDDENPLYGTAKVVIALREARERGFTIPPHRRREAPQPEDPLQAGTAWLSGAQGEDGGWSGLPGGPASIEETALAVEALAGTPGTKSASAAGIRWLVERVESGAWREPAPIGFYFAKLWYFEKLYPLIYTVGALGRAQMPADSRVPLSAAARPWP